MPDASVSPRQRVPARDDHRPTAPSLHPAPAERRATARPAAKPEPKPGEDVGERIRTALRTRLGDHKFEMWFGAASLKAQDGRLITEVESQFAAGWIEKSFGDELNAVATDILGAGAETEVRVREAASPPPSTTTSAAPASSPSRPRAARGRYGPRLRRLDEFVVGPSNRLAHGTALRLVDEPDVPISPLFIHGECGVGKTHLLQGICRRVAESTGRWSHIRYVTGEQFTNEYIASVRANSIDQFRRRIRRLDLLAIDDVHFLSNKVATQSEFLHTLDAIDLTGERVVLASDEHPRLIKRFSQALISRFLSGMVVQIDRPDRQTRLALVRRLASQRGLPISEAAMEAIASRCVGSVRELEGALTKLAALRAFGDGAEEHDPVGLVLVERLFADPGWQPAKPVRLANVIDRVCARLGVTRGDLMSGSRHRRVVLGRGLVSYLAREMTTHSYPEIARALGRAYHSTIHTAEQRLRGQLVEETMVEFGDAVGPMALRELTDQLRHEISQATNSE